MYSVNVDLLQQTAITKRGYLVQLGNHGKYQMLPIEQRITFETIYVYGFSGVGSAQDTGKQPFADALACPSDMVRVTGVNEIRAGARTVVAIKYPYSKANYKAAAKVLDQGYFKLRHPTVRTFVMEITVAISPIELQKMLNVRLVNGAAEDSSDDDDEEEAIDLRIAAHPLPEGERWSLEPDPAYARRVWGEAEEVVADVGVEEEESARQPTCHISGSTGVHDYGALTWLLCLWNTYLGPILCLVRSRPMIEWIRRQAGWAGQGGRSSGDSSRKEPEDGGGWHGRVNIGGWSVCWGVAYHREAS